MRRDHRPYYIKRLYLKLQNYYAKNYLKPQFDSYGRGQTVIKPWHIELFGPSIRAGSFNTFIASADKKVRLSVWSDNPDAKGITIGDYCLICPGVRISAAAEVTVRDSVMLASGVYITDADWHEIYDRGTPIGKTAPVILEENVWVGDSSIVCKGVTIGKNSIIGAGSVVVSDIPPDSIAVGNPARVVKQLDLTKEMRTRAHWLANPRKLNSDFDQIDRDALKNNTILGWMRSIIRPGTKD